MRELRRRAAFVFQAPTMFPGTVADNLRIARARQAGAPPLAGDEVTDALGAVELAAAVAGRQKITIRDVRH